MSSPQPETQWLIEVEEAHEHSASFEQHAHDWQQGRAAAIDASKRTDPPL